MSVKRITTGILMALMCPALAIAQEANTSCEIVLMPNDGGVEDGQFADADAFLESVYDGNNDGHMTMFGELPIRAVMCQRENLVPTMRDLPLLKTGLPLSLSQDFDSSMSGLLTLYDAGADFKAEYSGPSLSPEDEKKLRDTLEIFNFQKFIK